MRRVVRRVRVCNSQDEGGADEAADQPGDVEVHDELAGEDASQEAADDGSYDTEYRGAACTDVPHAGDEGAGYWRAIRNTRAE